MNMEMNDKEVRKALAGRYLEAETSLEEEREIREYYATHPAEEDDKAFAKLVLASVQDTPEDFLSEEAEREFDRIVGTVSKAAPGRRIFRWAAGIAAAAAIALPLLVYRPWEPREEPLNPLVLAEGIQNLLELDPGNIISIEAVPKGSKAILTAKMKDGKTFTYIMSVDGGLTSYTLAENNL